MSLPVKSIVPELDSQKKIASKESIAGCTILGGALGVGVASGVAAYKGKEIVAAAAQIGTWIEKQWPQIINSFKSIKGITTIFPHAFITPQGITIGSAALIGGAVLGGTIAWIGAPKASLNTLKEQLGVSGSELNFRQLAKVANIQASFLRRTTVGQHKKNEKRIQNLKEVVKDTELSLSKNAHAISKAVGTEKRYFHYEGAKLANDSHSAAEFVEATKRMESTIQGCVKETEGYTPQKGNALTTVSLRDYLFSRIIGAAHDCGIAQKYLQVVVKEREGTRQIDPKLAETQFKEALENGIGAGILAPALDGKCYGGMVAATATASQIASSKGNGNPDSTISLFFDAYQDAGLILPADRAQFTQDVRGQLSTPEAPIAASPEKNSRLMSVWNRFFHGEGHSKEKIQERQESGLSNPPRNAQEKKLMAEKNREIANLAVQEYTEELKRLSSTFQKLSLLYPEYIELKRKKLKILARVVGMGKHSLRGTVTMAHKEGVDPFNEYETNDEALKRLLKEIRSVDENIPLSPFNDKDFPQLPKNFSSASPEQRTSARNHRREAVQVFEKVRKYNHDAIALSKKIESIEETLGEDTGEANNILFPATEQGLPQPEEKKTSWPQKLFSKSVKELGQLEEGKAKQDEHNNTPIPSAPPMEEELNLPEPIIVPQTPRWKVWA